MMNRDATTPTTGSSARVALAGARQAVLLGLFIILLIL